MDIMNYVASIVISLTAGIGGFVLAYKIFDRMTYRFKFGEELKNNNQAVAIFLAGLFIGLGIIIGNAIQ
jgi:uncharacterized membrane protein YjfL (UPF0719 family)